jgi:hypothetical protein
VVADHEPVAIRPQPDEDEAEQRRAGQIEPSGPVPCHQPFGPPVPLRLGQRGQVDDLQGRLGIGADELHRPGQPLAGEGGAQTGVAGHERRARRAQPVGVHAVPDVEGDLRGVDVYRPPVIAGVEEQSFLQR